MIDCWIDIVKGKTIAEWQHYMALPMLAIVIYFFFKELAKTMIAVGGFFILGTFNIFSMEPGISSFQLGIGPFKTLPLNGLSFLLLLLFCVLNLTTIINLHLDHNNKKTGKRLSLLKIKNNKLRLYQIGINYYVTFNNCKLEYTFTRH